MPLSLTMAMRRKKSRKLSADDIDDDPWTWPKPSPKPKPPANPGVPGGLGPGGLRPPSRATLKARRAARRKSLSL